MNWWLVASLSLHKLFNRFRITSYNVCYTKLLRFDVPDYYRGTRYTTNALFGEYSYQANKWIGLGVTAVYFSYYSKYHDEQTDLQVGFNQISHLSVYPTLRYTWLKKTSYSLYSSFGMGLRTVIEYDDLRYNTTINGKIKLAAQFTLLGFTIGKDVFCFSDLSTVGTQGIITIGLGYRLQKAVQR